MFGINQTLMNLVRVFILQPDVLATNRITLSTRHVEEFFILNATSSNLEANCFGHQFGQHDLTLRRSTPVAVLIEIGSNRWSLCCDDYVRGSRFELHSLTGFGGRVEFEVAKESAVFFLFS